MRQAQLEERSLTELRAIAQGCGAIFTFATDKNHLVQAIRQKAIDLVPKPIESPPVIEEPDRIRIIPPARNVSRETITQTLKPFIDKGLRLSFPAQTVWKMELGKRVDTGNMRVPLRVIVRCAEQMLA